MRSRNKFASRVVRSNQCELVLVSPSAVGNTEKRVARGIGPNQYKFPAICVQHRPEIIIIVYLLTARVVGSLQMISQPVSSIFPCSPLPSGTWRTPGLSIPCCCLPSSSSICLVFFTFSLCLARWFWPDLLNGRRVHTTAVCVSL